MLLSACVGRSTLAARIECLLFEFRGHKTGARLGRGSSAAAASLLLLPRCFLQLVVLSATVSCVFFFAWVARLQPLVLVVLLLMTDHGTALIPVPLYTLRGLY